MDKNPGLSLKELRKLFATSPFISASGMELIEIDHDAETLSVSMALLPEFERFAGSGQFHGGPIASLIDTAGCFALVMLLGRGVPTVNFRTDYLRPAIDTGLTANALIRRVGRTVGVVDVDVINDEGKLVAVGRGTFGSNAG